MNIEYYTYYGYSIYFLQYNCVISFCILQNAVQKQDLRWYFAAVSLNISAKVFLVSSVLQKHASLLSQLQVFKSTLRLQFQCTIALFCILQC